MAETPAGWLPPRITGAVVVVADWVVVGSVVVVVSSVVVGSVVVLKAAVVVEAAVVVGSVVVLGVVTGSWLVAPGVACVLVAVVSLQPGASAVASRPPVVIGRLAADGLVSGLPVGGRARWSAPSSCRWSRRWTWVPARLWWWAAQPRVPGGAVRAGAAGWPRPPGRPGPRWRIRRQPAAASRAVVVWPGAEGVGLACASSRF